MDSKCLIDREIDRPRYIARRALFQALAVSVAIPTLGVSAGSNIAAYRPCRHT